MKDDKVPAPPRHGPGPRISEKPQNFKKSIKILLENIKEYKTSIIVSLLLALLGSILTIIGPNKISDITDTIAQGMMIGKINYPYFYLIYFHYIFF